MKNKDSLVLQTELNYLIRLDFAELNLFNTCTFKVMHPVLENLDHAYCSGGCFLISSKCEEDTW